MKYVGNSTNLLRKVLLCPPTYLELEPINVISENWLRNGERLDQKTCLREHEEFVQAYIENGVEVVLMEPLPELKYQVFARDFGACLADGYVMGSFREPCRRGESAVYEGKLKELGIPCVARCTSGAFEGGDFWFLDDSTIAHGIIARTDCDGFNNVKRQLERLGYVVYGVECNSRNLHLDMCFNIVAEKTAVICREALPENFLQNLERRGFELIEVPQEGVFRHYCNIQCLGGYRVLTFKNNREVNDKLRALGLTVIAVELEEILKAGGGPHCMTFPLLRD